MAKRRKNRVVLDAIDARHTYSRETRWAKDGICETRIIDNGKDSGWQRDPGMDFGTPMGDLIICPWIQDILKEKP